jgi:hypothetical protein
MSSTEYIRLRDQASEQLRQESWFGAAAPRNGCRYSQLDKSRLKTH